MRTAKEIQKEITSWEQIVEKLKLELEKATVPEPGDRVAYRTNGLGSLGQQMVVWGTVLPSPRLDEANQECIRQGRVVALWDPSAAMPYFRIGYMHMSDIIILERKGERIVG